MENPTDICKVALANVSQGISSDRRFPRNVFVGDWCDYYFFDSDWMMVDDFVRSLHAFLEAEGGSCACLCKVDSDDVTEPRVFAVHKETTANEYGALLAGEASGYGWVDAVERLACASDVGEWCMYCEPNNDMAVIGFRHRNHRARYSVAMERLHATHVDKAIKEQISYGFSDRALSPQWRSELMREYLPSAE